MKKKKEKKNNSKIIIKLISVYIIQIRTKTKKKNGVEKLRRTSLFHDKLFKRL